MLKVLKAIEKGYDKLLSATGAFATGVMLLLAILVFMLTFSRYVLQINIPGLFDGASYSMIVFPFLTAAYTLRLGQHVSVDIITSRLPERTRTLLNITTYLAASIYVIILGWQSWRWAVNLFQHQVLTDAVFQIQKGILVLIIAFGCLLLLFQIIRVLVHNIRSLSSLPTPSPRLRDNPWLYPALFIIGILIGIVLFINVSPVAGIALLALVILFSGMPIFFALGLLAALGTFFLLGSPSFLQFPITVYKSMSSFPLTCLPLFILGGLIMAGSGIIEDIFRFFELWTRRFVASPLLVTIAAGMVFCAISGVSTAVTAVIAGVAMPILTSRGYRKSLSSGTVGGATVGTLIPPSIGYVVFAVITEESIAQIFMAALVPSAILFSFYFLYVIVLGLVSKKSLFEKGEIPSETTFTQVTWKDKLLSLRTAMWGLMAPLIILGGIYMGIYTPTEAAGVLVVYSIIVAVFIKRVSWQSLIKITLRGAVISSMILCIMFSAFIFALFVSQSRIAVDFVAYAEATGMTSLAVLGIIFIFLLVLGFFLDAASLKVITLPIFYPLAKAVGINPLWLAVFWQVLGEIGLLTPPVGMNLFVIRGVTGLPLGTIIKGNAPFVLMMVLMLVVILLFPQLVTWLPGTMK